MAVPRSLQISPDRAAFGDNIRLYAEIARLVDLLQASIRTRELDLADTSRTELGYLNGVTSGIQGQINAIIANRAAKGWINFNGQGTIAINDSFNVSGIVDNGVGKYTVTWDVDFASTSYAAVGTAAETASTPYNQINLSTSNKLVGSVDIGLVDIGNLAAVSTVFVDVADIDLVAFGDQ